MRIKTLGIVAAVVACAAVGTAAEKKIQMKDLPPAVRSAVEAETKGSTVKALSTEIENGKRMYEAETTRDGRSRDLLFDAKGTLVEVEEELALGSAPEPVKAALAAHGGKVLKLESVRKGTTTAYEAQVQRNGKKSEVRLDASGKPSSKISIQPCDCCSSRTTQRSTVCLPWISGFSLQLSGTPAC